MATTQKYKAKIDFRRRGNVPSPRLRLAVREALRETAKPLVILTKQFAERRIKFSPSKTNRGARRYTKQMVDSYEAEVLSDGKTLSLRNPLLRARVFEMGSKPHVITPKRGRFLYFRAGKPGRGHRVGDLIRARRVNHPGTQARYPMRDAMQRQMPFLGSRLTHHINKELKARGK